MIKDRDEIQMEGGKGAWQFKALTCLHLTIGQLTWLQPVHVHRILKNRMNNILAMH